MSTSLIVSQPNHPLLVTLEPDPALLNKQVEKVTAYINQTLKHHESTKHVALDWSVPTTEDPRPMTISQMVKRSQDKRRLGMDSNGVISKEGAKSRRAEFNSIRAVFILEDLNNLLIASLYRLGFQPRVQGAAKDGKVTVHFVRPDRKSDVVDKRVIELAASLQGVRMRKALVATHGEEAVAKFESSGELEVLGITIE